MTRSEINNEYFNWLCEIVCGDRSRPYMKLLNRLHDTDFTYTISLDGNRADDGENLRYQFGDEYDYNDAMIASYLDNRPCSVLEMMIALAMRCETNIMHDPDIGNRTGQWFWDMISNLGLGSMDDYNFDSQHVDAYIQRFLDREYAYNGKGGLFTIRNCKRDLRSVEIWYQMCWYLDSII